MFSIRKLVVPCGYKLDFLALTATSRTPYSSDAALLKPKFKYTFTPRDRTPVEFEVAYKKLNAKFDEGLFVKATEMNVLLYNTDTLEQLHQARKMQARFRTSTSFSRPSQSTVFVRVCINLKVPYLALETIAEPVTFGIFPSRDCYRELLHYFMTERDIDGAQKTIQLMKEQEETVGGFELLFLVKTSILKFMEQYSAHSVNATPTEDTPPVSDSEPIPFETLEPTLKICSECFNLEESETLLFGRKAVYYINGHLLGEERFFHLSAQMVDILEAKSLLPKKNLIDLKVDYFIAKNDLQGMLDCLRQAEADGYLMSIRKKRFPRYQELFQNCGDPQLLQAFNELKVKEEVPESSSAPELKEKNKPETPESTPAP